MPILGKITGTSTAARTQQALALRDAQIYGRDSYRPARIAGPGG